MKSMLTSNDQLLLNRGIKLQLDKDFIEAEKIYLKLLKKYYQNFYINFLLGFSLY